MSVSLLLIMCYLKLIYYKKIIGLIKIYYFKVSYTIHTFLYKITKIITNIYTYTHLST